MDGALQLIFNLKALDKMFVSFEYDNRSEYYRIIRKTMNIHHLQKFDLNGTFEIDDFYLETVHYGLTVLTYVQ